MDPHAGKIVVNGATSQYDRWLSELAPDFVRVDGRSLTELLDFANRFAELIHFYDLDDLKDGDWTGFFRSDSTMMLAAILATDLTAIENRFSLLERQTHEARRFKVKFPLLRATFAVILDLARQVNLWLEGLQLANRSETARLLEEEITVAIEGELGQQLRTLKAYAEGAGQRRALRRPIRLDYQGFLPIWELDDVLPDDSIYRGHPRTRKIDCALPHLNPIFYAFYDAVLKWQAFARANFDATLEESDHKPQIGLYIAFVRLFGNAQNTINTLPARYTRFYYHDVLREPRRGPVPDSLYLTFVLAEDEDVARSSVPRGTLFPAGEDSEGLEILYAADRALEVTAAQIASLLTLRVDRGELLVGPSGLLAESFLGVGAHDALAMVESPPSPVAQRILTSEILTELDSDVGPEQRGWATFGKTETGSSPVEMTELATLGFAISSPYLLLTGGQRRVRLAIRFTVASSGVLKTLLRELADATGESPEWIFHLVLQQAFTVYLSTAGGWLPVESYDVVRPPAYSVRPTDELTGFELEFELPASVPPIVAYDPEDDDVEEADDGLPVSEDPAVTATNPDPTQPTLKAYLNQQPVSLGEVTRLAGDASPPEAEVYPLSLLSEMEVAAFRIHTEVRGLTNLEVANTDGEVDTTSPFLPFGGVPVVGSYLSISQRELFEKTLATLQMRLDWFDLPPNDTGFWGYYRYYTLGLDGQEQPDLFDNRKFRVDIDVREPGSWTLEDSSDLYLYRSQHQGSPPTQTADFSDGCERPIPAPADKLCSETGFDHLRVEDSSPPPYYDPSNSAIRMTLTEPDYAFGNDLYAKNVLNAVIEDLPNAEKCQVDCKAECQPLKEAEECIQACITCISTCQSPPALSASASSPSDGYVDRCLSDCMDCLNTTLEACWEQCRKSCVDDSECLEACVEKCGKIQDAIECVKVCASSCRQGEASYAECVSECLEGCRADLATAWEDCLEVCMADCMSIKGELKYPNEPYLPQASQVSLDYSAGCSWPATGEDCAKFFLLWPFDGVSMAVAEGGFPLLPRFAYPGNLYLGFSDLAVPETLTLLFQMAADRAGANELPPVVWEVLKDNCWTSLQTHQILSDTTGGLAGTGIVTLSLPTYDPTNSTLMPTDAQWLRVSVGESPGSFPDTVAISPQVLTATWVDAGAAGEHLSQPLPAGTITSSVEALPNIETIDQPLESFGGRPPETRRDYDVRVGERLRHKDRAILEWDYERLVLERFPTIWKVQALPAHDSCQSDVPGAVLVMVVPGPDSQQLMDPTVPVASGDLLRRIEDYLARRINPFIDVRVVNPIYVRIEVTVTVLFAEQESAGASIERLNEDLVAYLSPWFYDAARAARGGSYVSQADISEFVQTRPYVEALDQIAFDYQPSPETLDCDWYFLTSAETHQIYDSSGGIEPDETCY